MLGKILRFIIGSRAHDALLERRREAKVRRRERELEAAWLGRHERTAWSRNEPVRVRIGEVTIMQDPPQSDRDF